MGGVNRMDGKELKQKIRKLKRLELMFRYGFSMEYIEKNSSALHLEKLPLVWKEFFDFGQSGSQKPRYSYQALEKMDKEQVKQVFGEFWFRVYYRMYQEKGLQMGDVQEPELLAFLGLPYDADQAAIRRRFHELCKAYHPDEGGDTDKFIELMKIREKYELK
jgi:hypothetical protein